MTREMISSAKLQFYPTDEFETWRILGILGDLKIDMSKESNYRDLLDDFVSEAKKMCMENYKIMDYQGLPYTIICLKDKDTRKLNNYSPFISR